ncbi:MAG: bifunctional adenosylcobinamide kinase/adenosylcobinamide-phosphate guanylyltransferase [Clostridia bacterium]|nr:bifunctional adenosylcobinamide kinase/adenosylcobinamide-phosphate guanylyltransferase [Clostridia bacterium]
MILVIGGFASGKRTYVKEVLGYTDEDMTDQAIDERRVVYNAQNMAMGDPEAIDKTIEELCRKDVVIACEIGLGIIPLDKNERMLREAAGRMTNRLAKRADKVIRMVCGIPLVLKG